MKKLQGLLFTVFILSMFFTAVSMAALPVGGLNPECVNYSPVLGWIMLGSFFTLLVSTFLIMFFSESFTISE